MSGKAKRRWRLWTKSWRRRRTGSSRKTMQVSPPPTPLPRSKHGWLSKKQRTNEASETSLRHEKLTSVTIT